MKHINELSVILNNYLNWNKARISCLSQIVLAIVRVKTVNLTQIAGAFASSSKIESSYRRIQRFFSSFNFDQTKIVKIILAMFPLPDKITLTMDRTNWKWGKSHINILVIGIVYKNIAIPIFWNNLGKAGNSNTSERISIVAKVIKYIGVKRIENVLADREFIGEKWFEWLINSKINFVIRIRSNLLIKQYVKDPLPIPVATFFKRLKCCRKKIIKQSFWVGKHKVFLSASKSPKGELLIVASPIFLNNALEIYKKRWEIETLFSYLKSKGFRLEDTHMTNIERIEKLFFILAIAFCWAYKIGIEREKEQPIKIKKHGRKSYSLFRYGYEVLRNAIVNNVKMLKKLLRVFLTTTPLKSINWSKV